MCIQIIIIIIIIIIIVIMLPNQAIASTPSAPPMCVQMCIQIMSAGGHGATTCQHTFLISHCWQLMHHCQI
jgi:hypothetical protein